MKLKLKGIVNGVKNESLFALNPHGWLGVTVEIEMPYRELSLEEAFINAAKKKIRFMPVNVAKDIQIVPKFEN